MIGPALEWQHIDLVSAEKPEYTVDLSYDPRDQVWEVTVTVHATGQRLGSRYYAAPSQLQVPAIAARLYNMRKRG